MPRLVLLLFCFGSYSALSAADLWNWFKVSTNIDHAWDTNRGTAEVTIQGRQFTAKLFWSDSKTDVQIELKGSIVKGKLTVTETVFNTDFGGPSKYRGGLTTLKFAQPLTNGDAGFQTITLTDGLAMIGLTRVIR